MAVEAQTRGAGHRPWGPSQPQRMPEITLTQASIYHKRSTQSATFDIWKSKHGGWRRGRAKQQVGRLCLAGHHRLSAGEEVFPFGMSCEIDPYARRVVAAGQACFFFSNGRPGEWTPCLRGAAKWEGGERGGGPGPSRKIIKKDASDRGSDSGLPGDHIV